MVINHALPQSTAVQTQVRLQVDALLASLGMPLPDSGALALAGSGAAYPSSFRIDVAAAASLAASALVTAQIGALRQRATAPSVVHLDIDHVLAESTGYFTLDNVSPALWAPLSGLYRCGDALGQPGQLRIHANFAHHRDGVLQLLGLPVCESTSKKEVTDALQAWSATNFEADATERGLVVAAVRTPQEWAAHGQSQALAEQPLVSITALDAHQPAPPRTWPALAVGAAPLNELRVLDLSRILAGPVAARTLAAQGAEVLMVNGPGLPNIEAIADLSRGKRSALLDLKSAADHAQLAHLLGDAHVLLQAYRPGSLQALGFGPQAAAAMRPGLVYASLSAYGRTGPWADRRGFDSLVQTVSGINVAEAAAFGEMQPRALPIQILDYSAGFFLALGIGVALYRQATRGGSWHVEVSLARVAQWLQSLGHRPVDRQAPALDIPTLVQPYLECVSSGFGVLQAVRHSAQLSGVQPRWLHPAMPPGSDLPQWRDTCFPGGKPQQHRQ